MFFKLFSPLFPQVNWLSDRLPLIAHYLLIKNSTILLFIVVNKLLLPHKNSKNNHTNNEAHLLRAIIISIVIFIDRHDSRFTFCSQKWAVVRRDTRTFITFDK